MTTTIPAGSAANAPAAGVREFILIKKDVGVALVVALALAAAYFLRQGIIERTTTFTDPTTHLTVNYPATWGNVDSLQQPLLKVEDPRTNSTFKTNLTVEARGLDPASPPTLQTLVDREVEAQSRRVAFHLLSTSPTTVDGKKAMRIEYVYVEQPIDQPGRNAIPVVAHAIEQVVVGKENVFFITLAAPEDEIEKGTAQLDEILETVKLP